MTQPTEIEDDVLLETAERLLRDALETLRMLTPEGWDRAWMLALTDQEWHTVDVGRLRDAGLLAVRAGGRKFRDDTYGRIYS